MVHWRLYKKLQHHVFSINNKQAIIQVRDAPLQAGKAGNIF
jgi:hypothetical protein